MLNVVIFGAPGSGKGTQSELIIKCVAFRDEERDRTGQDCKGLY